MANFNWPTATIDGKKYRVQDGNYYDLGSGQKLGQLPKKQFNKFYPNEEYPSLEPLWEQDYESGYWGDEKSRQDIALDQNRVLGRLNAQLSKKRNLKENQNMSFPIPSLEQVYGQTMTPRNRVSDYMDRFNNLGKYTLSENATDYSGNMIDTNRLSPDYADLLKQYASDRTDETDPPPPPGSTKKGTDWLGWSQVASGLLQGLAGWKQAQAMQDKIPLLRDELAFRQASYKDELGDKRLLYNNAINQQKGLLTSDFYSDPTRAASLRTLPA